MKKMSVLVMLFLALFIGVVPSAFGGVPLCRVGLSPWWEGRPFNPAVETEYRFKGHREITTLGKRGVPWTCVLDPSDSTVVMPNGFNPEIDSSGLASEDLPWLRVCGNPIVSKFRISDLVRVERSQAVQQKAVNLNYSPPPPTQKQEQNLFLIMAPAAPAPAEKAEKENGTCWWCWALVALAMIGVWAYAYSVSQDDNDNNAPPPDSGGPVDTGGDGPINPLPTARFR